MISNPRARSVHCKCFYVHCVVTVSASGMNPEAKLYYSCLYFHSGWLFGKRLWTVREVEVTCEPRVLAKVCIQSDGPMQGAGDRQRISGKDVMTTNLAATRVYPPLAGMHIPNKCTSTFGALATQQTRRRPSSSAGARC